MSDSDPPDQPTELINQGVRILKYLDESKFDVVTALFYNIESRVDAPLELTITEPIPDGFDFSDLQRHDDFEGGSWEKDGNNLVFTRQIDPGEEVVTLLGFNESERSISSDFVASPPEIETERLDPISAAETVGEKLLEELEEDDISENVKEQLAEAFVDEIDEEAVTQSQLETVTRELLGIQDRLDDFEAELDEVRDNVAELKSEQVSTGESLSIVERRLDELQSEYQAEVTSLNRSFKELSEEMDDVRDKTSDLPEDVDSWLRGIEDDLDTVQDEVESFNTNIGGAFEDIRDRLDTTEENIGSLQNKTQSELAAAGKDREKLQKKVMALKNAIERLANRHDEMDEDVEELDAVLGQLIVALDEVETVVGASDGEIIPSDLVRETKAPGHILR